MAQRHTMASLSTKCATTASLLALATLPSDRSINDRSVTHDDFALARGHIRRTINGETVHGVDWDGAPGIESILRENGRRSRGMWKEFRAWRRGRLDAGVEEAGDVACDLLLKHFGPYHQATSDALSRRRCIERERTQAALALDKECPLALRLAARNYLAQHFAPLLKIPPVLQLPRTGLLLGGDESTNALSLLHSHELPVDDIFSRPESVLREFMTTSAFLTNVSSVEDAAKSVVAKIQPLEEKLDMLDITHAVMGLPPIPGERKPADMDLIEFGALICRHRAVIVGLLLADAGFEVELVSGTITKNGHSGAHLFIYCKDQGILEPSADGPHYWRRTVAALETDRGLVLSVDEHTTYTFGTRTPLNGASAPLSTEPR